MTIEELQNNYAGHTVEIKRLIHKDLPKILGNLAVSMFKDNFQNEGFFGTPWKEVARQKLGGTSGKRKILTGTGNLGRSIQYVPGDASVTIFSDVAYAKVHNEGGVTHPEITPKMRKFAWAMFYKSLGNKKRAKKLSNESIKWMAIAITKNNGLNIRIDKRQFIGEHQKLADAIREKTLEKLNKIINKNG